MFFPHPGHPAATMIGKRATKVTFLKINCFEAWSTVLLLSIVISLHQFPLSKTCKTAVSINLWIVHTNESLLQKLPSICLHLALARFSGDDRCRYKTGMFPRYLFHIIKNEPVEPVSISNCKNHKNQLQDIPNCTLSFNHNSSVSLFKLMCLLSLYLQYTKKFV